jgi:hypothetical protein
MDSKTFVGSVPSVRSQLDLGSMPNTDVSILQSDVHSYYPLSNIRDPTATIEIHIPSSFSIRLENLRYTSDFEY